MGGSSGPSKTTQTTEPPAFIKPFLQFGAQEAQNLYRGGGPEYFPGSTVVPFSDQTRQALDLTQQRALQGNAGVDAAQGYVQNTLGTDPSSQFTSAQNPFASQTREFAGATNPYLDATFNRAADNVQNRLQSSFAGSGRNIGAARAPAALELNDLANTIYGGAYESDRNRSLSELQQQRGIGAQGFENAQGRGLDDIQQQRGLQLSAAGLAPGLAANDYADLAALEGVGGRYEDLSGQYLDDEINRFNFQQQAPQMNLDRFLQRILGSFPGQTTTTTAPNSRNRAAGALGGAATGAALGGAAAGAASGAAAGSVVPGVGTLIGAGLGGLLGYFGS
jgi:hypothetical protein